MKFIKLLLLLLLLIITSCTIKYCTFNEFRDNNPVDDEEIKNFLTREHFTDCHEDFQYKWRYLAKWIRNNIEWVSDRKNHGKIEDFQSPHETYTSKKGDCEDMVFLFSYFMWKYMNIDTIIYGQFIGIGEKHMSCGYGDQKFYWSPNAKRIWILGTANELFEDFEK